MANTGDHVAVQLCDDEGQQQPMTIFYMGSVRTYEQVPHDKAKAMMLLLSGRSSSSSRRSSISSSSFTSDDVITRSSAYLLAAGHDQVQLNAVAKARRESTCSWTCYHKHCALQSKAQLYNDELQGGSRTEALCKQLSNASTIPANAPAASRFRGLIKRSQAELPFARKASLARFLQKRKDRVQVEESNVEERLVGQLQYSAVDCSTHEEALDGSCALAHACNRSTSTEAKRVKLQDSAADMISRVHTV